MKKLGISKTGRRAATSKMDGKEIANWVLVILLAVILSVGGVNVLAHYQDDLQAFVHREWSIDKYIKPILRGEAQENK